MLRKSRLFCLVCCLAVLAPALAMNPVLQATMTGASGATVSLAVYNPSATPQSGRVSVTVSLDSGRMVTLTSGNLTVGPGDTTQVVLDAPAPIKIIDDDPEPF